MIPTIKSQRHSLSFLLSACQAMTGRTAGRNIDDLTITASVKARLVAESFEFHSH